MVSFGSGLARTAPTINSGKHNRERHFAGTTDVTNSESNVDHPGFDLLNHHLLVTPESRQKQITLNAQLPTINCLELFVHYLDLLVDHLASESIDCEVHPVMLLPLDHEIVRETCCVWFVMS